MKLFRVNQFTVAFALSATLLATPALAAQMVNANASSKIIAAWAERPRLGAVEMIAKYGQPQEATGERLIWNNAGPYQRITVMNIETPHDFPLPHVDFLEHTILYNVPQDKVGDLIAFDASSTINRTVGELSARCDLEGHNVLTLNLDHDIIMGKKTVEQARQAFGDIVKLDVAGQHPPYVEALQFQPMQMAAAAFSDQMVIAGSGVRANDQDAQAQKLITANGSKTGDAEILAMMMAVDLNEVTAAAEAQKEKLTAPAMAYAKMLHQMHGEAMGMKLKLAGEMGITPVETAAVEKMKIKASGELAALIPMDGKAFERGYIAMMAKGHADVLTKIDTVMLPTVRDPALKQALVAMRASVASHLEQARQLQGAAKNIADR